MRKLIEKAQNKFLQRTCKHDKLKAKKVANPMVYDCMKCGKVIKSKKQK